MNTTEWIAACNYVGELWGTSEKWLAAKDNTNKTIARDYTTGSVRSAITDMHAQGREFTPATSQVFALAKAAGGYTPDQAPCTHIAVAVLEVHSDGTAKEGLCASCRVPYVWAPGEYEDTA